MNKFFVIRKDGTSMLAAASLGAAMNEMRAGYLLFMGTPTEALAIRKKLFFSKSGMSGTGPRYFGDENTDGALLAIGLDANEGREL